MAYTHFKLIFIFMLMRTNLFFTPSSKFGTKVALFAFVAFSFVSSFLCDFANAGLIVERPGVVGRVEARRYYDNQYYQQPYQQPAQNQASQAGDDEDDRPKKKKKAADQSPKDENGKHFVSWKEFTDDTLTIVEKIKKSKKSFKGIVVINSGGLVPSAILSQALEIDMIESFDVVPHSNSKTAGLDSFKVLVSPKQALEDKGEGWLVINNVVGGGGSSEYVLSKLPNSFIITVYIKSSTNKKLVDIYAKEVDDSKWLVMPWEPQK